MADSQKIVLVKREGKPITVGVGINCFPIENNQVQGEMGQRIGAEISGPDCLRNYFSNLELAVWAWKNQLFDEIEEH